MCILLSLNMHKRCSCGLALLSSKGSRASQALPVQTNAPTTPAQSTTVAPPSTALPTSCTGLANNARCAAAQTVVSRHNQATLLKHPPSAGAPWFWHLRVCMLWWPAAGVCSSLVMNIRCEAQGSACCPTWAYLKCMPCPAWP